MEKKFNKFELGIIKRTAQNVYPIEDKIRKLVEKKNELDEEILKYTEMKKKYEEPVFSITQGHSTTELVEKIVETTGAVDKNGKPVKVTKYVFKYPETILPPTEQVKEYKLPEVEDYKFPEEIIDSKAVGEIGIQ